MRKILIILSILIALTAISYFGLKFYGATHVNEDRFLSRLATKIFDYNKVEVDIEDGIDSNDIKIVHRQNEKAVFENGETHKVCLNDYGLCCFEIYYKDTLLSEICQYRENNWHVNTYHFDVYKTENGVDAILEIYGIDSLDVVYYVDE
jgi:hypothetical protein